MSIRCNHCEGTGFVNAEQIPDGILDKGPEEVVKWIDETQTARMKTGGCSCHIGFPPCSHCMNSHDVAVCTCCGDGEGWYGVPGQHYNSEDPIGKDGPYSGNGGLCKCH